MLHAVIHSNKTFRSLVPLRIVIPGYYIQYFRHLMIIDRREIIHQIRRNRLMISCIPQCLDLCFAEINRLIADETFPVQNQSVNGCLTQRCRTLDLIKILIIMTPESRIPLTVYFLDIIVIFFL